MVGNAVDLLPGVGAVVFCGMFVVFDGTAAGVCGCAVGGLDRSDWARFGSMVCCV